ncbi:Protein takeout [Pseudolycoriella hygida]|uniref:Protein takeout n=1 Tax=Pseudolycoriella hygida TaxID=35572 RepID=A0A9Q0MRL9_9DIPT|nr:Protein takeout [Pseudolycoriella hygida]
MSKMKSKIAIFLAALFIGCASCVEKIPSTIERCKVDDEECLVRTWNEMTLVAYKSGIPELDLPLSDKHFVDKQVLSIGSEVLKITITFTNVTVIGLAKTKYSSIKGFKKDPKEMSGFEITGFTPFMSVRGHYVGSGKLLLLPVTGSGLGEVLFGEYQSSSDELTATGVLLSTFAFPDNTTFTFKILTKAEVRDGEEYLSPTKIICDYKSDKHHFSFENILNNKEISDALNQVLNDNEELFSKEVKGAACLSVSNVLKRAIFPVFKKYPYRSFFLD